MCILDGLLVCWLNYYGLNCFYLCIFVGNKVCNKLGDFICVKNFYGWNCFVYCVLLGNFICNDVGKL